MATSNIPDASTVTINNNNQKPRRRISRQARRHAPSTAPSKPPPRPVPNPIPPKPKPKSTGPWRKATQERAIRARENQLITKDMVDREVIEMNYRNQWYRALRDPFDHRSGQLMASCADRGVTASIRPHQSRWTSTFTSVHNAGPDRFFFVCAPYNYQQGVTGGSVSSANQNQSIGFTLSSYSNDGAAMGKAFNSYISTPNVKCDVIPAVPPLQAKDAVGAITVSNTISGAKQALTSMGVRVTVKCNAYSRARIICADTSRLQQTLTSSNFQMNFAGNNPGETNWGYIYDRAARGTLTTEPTSMNDLALSTGNLVARVAEYGEYHALIPASFTRTNPFNYYACDMSYENIFNLVDAQGVAVLVDHSAGGVCEMTVEFVHNCCVLAPNPVMALTLPSETTAHFPGELSGIIYQSVSGVGMTQADVDAQVGEMVRAVTRGYNVPRQFIEDHKRSALPASLAYATAANEAQQAKRQLHEDVKDEYDQAFCRSAFQSPECFVEKVSEAATQVLSNPTGQRIAAQMATGFMRNAMGGQNGQASIRF